MATMSKAEIARQRAAYGLPPESASDAKWERWIREGSRTAADLDQALFGRSLIEGTGNPAGRGATGDADARADNPIFHQPDPVTHGTAPAPTTDPTTSERESLRSLAQDLVTTYPWMPQPLVDIFIEEFINSAGNPDVAMARMRQSAQYEIYFPGNKTEDGLIQLPEAEYVAGRDTFNLELISYGIDPDVLGHIYPTLVAGGIRPDDFRRRMATLYTDVASNTPFVRQVYAEEFGSGDISIASLMANGLDPSTNPMVFEERIKKSQIGGEMLQAGLNLDMTHVTRLAGMGLNQQSAREFYGQARTLLPTLNNLMTRHNDPDDEFDINELSDALLISDPDQLEVIQRLFGQERSMFSPLNLFQIQQGGAVAGLRQR